MSTTDAMETKKNILEKNKCNNGQKGACYINKQMLPYKLHYFFYEGGVGATIPFGSVVGISRYGLSAGHLTATFTAQKITYILVKPVIGYLTDYFNSLKVTIFILSILHIIFALGMIIIPLNHVANESEYEHLNRTSPGNVERTSMHKMLSELTIFPLPSSYENESLVDGINDTETVQKHFEEIYKRCSQRKFNSSNSCCVELKITYNICNIAENRNLSYRATNLSINLNEQYFALSTKPVNVSEAKKVLCFDSDFSFKHPKVGSSGDSCSVQGMKLEILCDPVHLQCKGERQFICGRNMLNYTPEGAEGPLPTSTSTVFKSYQYWVFTACLICSTLFGTSINTISDAACYEAIQKTKSSYGRQRVWGSLSMGLVAPLAGFINDYTKGYFVSWVLLVVFFALQFLNLSRVDLVKPDLCEHGLANVKALFQTMEFVAFEIGIFMNGFFYGLVWSHLPWYLTTIGGNRLVIGLNESIRCVFGEVPCLFFSNWIIKKLGHFQILSLALFSQAVKFFFYSYIYNPWWTLPLEVWDGIAFGAFYAAMTSYGKLNSKPGAEAVTQSVLNVTYEAVGACLGSLISGVCFELFGGHTTFFFASVICMMAGCINVFFTMLLNFRKDAVQITMHESKPRMDVYAIQ